MGDCPESEAIMRRAAISSRDVGSKPGFLAAERFYEAPCATCGRTVVAGVAGTSDGRPGPALSRVRPSDNDSYKPRAGPLTGI
ncbi:hypothetical protein BRD13_08285 [Halobacteriales archaeon SW_5_70_135]|nr:MAG: hypothetical protein BRD13_08285 [Halobacteriales archaeon SW_5_70_135]